MPMTYSQEVLIASAWRALEKLDLRNAKIAEAAREYFKYRKQESDYRSSKPLFAEYDFKLLIKLMNKKDRAFADLYAAVEEK